MAAPQPVAALMVPLLSLLINQPRDRISERIHLTLYQPISSIESPDDDFWDFQVTGNVGLGTTPEFSEVAKKEIIFELFFVMILSYFLSRFA